MSKFSIGEKLHSLKEKILRSEILTERINSKNWLLLFAFLTCFSLFFYLWQVNGLATKGYLIKDLEERAANLKEENKKLELGITALRSTARINEEVKNLGMVEVVRVEYLKANGSAVAINR